jgi:hypothetical protein
VPASSPDQRARTWRASVSASSSAGKLAGAEGGGDAGVARGDEEAGERRLGAEWLDVEGVPDVVQDDQH